MSKESVPMLAFTHDSIDGPDADHTATLFDGPGEMRARCRAFGWGATALGPVSTWSLSACAIIRTMLASRHPMFIWLGPELVQVFNDGYLPLFGTSGRDLLALGARGREHWPEIWDVIGPQIAAVMEGGEATWHEDHLVPIHRNGALEDVYWTYGYSPIHDDDGGICGTLVVCTETTGRVVSLSGMEHLAMDAQRARATADHARDAMARVFAQAPVAIAVLEGRELRYIVANPRYQHLIGERDPVGKTLIEMFPELGGTGIERVLRRVYDTGIAFAADNLMIHFDSDGDGGRDNYYDLVYQPLSDAGQVIGIVVVAVDVTEHNRTLLDRDRLVTESQIARAEAEYSNRAKGDFLAMMSHELRTPLNAIAGYAGLIAMGIHGPVTAAQATALDRIIHCERHLLGLISNVLDYAKVEAGSHQYVVRDVVIEELLAECAALAAPQADAKGLTLTVGASAASPCARADEAKLRQIIVNLLANAIKFTAPGGRVVLDAGTLDDRNVRVSVSDTGCGISPADLERVFLPFVQVDARLTRLESGTGLGLAISRELARGMNGDLTVDSTAGVGSRFTLRLPGGLRRS
jgi:signal transduction histidine kinase